MRGGGGLRIVVLCPHFRPDTAPTGTVMTRIVEELAPHGHTLHVVTSLPWYRRHAVEPGWSADVGRHETTAWGSVTRVNPFSGDDKRNLVRRGVGFAAFSLLAGGGGLGRRRLVPPGRRGDRDVAAAHTRHHRAPRRVVAPRPADLQHPGRVPRRRCDHRCDQRPPHPRRGIAAGAMELPPADAVTVLSDDLAANVRAKLPAERAATVHVIPNFVDTERIQPADRMTPYRRRARHRRRAGGALCRQPRLLATVGADGARRPRAPGGHVRDQRRGRAARRTPRVRRRSAQRPLRRLPARGAPRRTARHRGRPRRRRCAAASPAPACRRRPTRPSRPAARSSRRSTPAPR